MGCRDCSASLTESADTWDENQSEESWLLSTVPAATARLIARHSDSVINLSTRGGGHKIPARRHCLGQQGRKLPQCSSLETVTYC